MPCGYYNRPPDMLVIIDRYKHFKEVFSSIGTVTPISQSKLLNPKSTKFCFDRQSAFTVSPWLF